MGGKITLLLIAFGVIIIAVIAAIVIMDKRKSEDEHVEKPRKNKEVKQKVNQTTRDRRLTDYDTYVMSRKEKIKYMIIAAIALFAVGYIFYRSIFLSIILAALCIKYPKIKTKELIERRKQELNLQFKDALYALSSSLGAGKSIEMAFKDSLKDLRILYPEEETHIIKELEIIVHKIEMNETIEDALLDFAERSHLEDVMNFVDVFITCKRTGGNIIEITKNTTNIIGDKIQIKQDISTLIASKKFEQKVLNAMPIFLILFLSVSSSDYMEPIFTEFLGRILMTIAIGLLGISYVVSKKIMDIEV